MSRLPRISKNDLRTHADDARVERIWQRMKDDLPKREARPRSVGRVALLAAALVSVFAGGLVVGRVTLPGEIPVEAVATVDVPMSDVFAAGSQPRSFALPRGGKLLLEADSLVEVVEIADASITLSLLRGGASLDATLAEGTFAVLAGEARISAAAGSSMSLARRESDIDVVALSGSVDVTSPAGHHVVNRGQALAQVPTITKVSARGEVEPVPEPVHVAMTPPRDRVATSQRLPSDPQLPVGPADPVAVAAVEPTQPSWLSLAAGARYAEALDALEKGPGLETTIEHAQSARELMLLAETAGSKHGALRVRALHRVADGFESDPNATAAAYFLSKIYEQSDKALAAKYREKMKQVAAFREIALCTELKNSEPEAAAQKASEYLASFPKGSCADDARMALEDAASPAKTEPKKDAPKEPAPADSTQPGASQPGASQPGASQPGASQPGAPQPGAPPGAAAQPKAAASASASPSSSASAAPPASTPPKAAGAHAPR